MFIFIENSLPAFTFCLLVVDSETVVLCYPVSTADIRDIEAAFPGGRIIASSQDDIGKDIHQATIFCGHGKQQQIDWDAVVGAGKLKWIQSSAAGLDHCLTPSVCESDIVVSGCSGLFANQVSEQTLALLMAMLRSVPTFLDAQSKREFVRRPTDTLHGKSVGIVGFGGNGRRIAAVLKNLAGLIVATDMFPDFDPPDYVDVLPANQKNRLFEVCDVVVVTLPLTAETHKSIGRNQFSKMKNGSYFINVARGAVVDQGALLDALADGSLAYAGLDVLDPEPPPKNDPIWGCKNILITPHVGAQCATRVPMTTRLFCKNARRWRDGGTLLNQVDKQLQFPMPEHRISVDFRGQFNL